MISFKKIKDNANEAQFIPIGVKNNIEKMEMEQGLYSQVFKLRQNDLKFIVESNNNNEAKFKFKDQSARSQHWFDLDFDWIEVNFRSIESN